MSRFAYDKETKQSTIIAGSQPPVTIAGTERTSIASQPYTVGQYLVYGGFLYKVISAIALGDALVIGTNIQVTTVGNEITDIYNDLTASNAIAGVTDVPFRFGCDNDGNFGYILTEGGADTVHPFKSGSDYNPTYLGSFNTRSNVSFPAEVGKHYVIFANNGIAGAGYSFNISGATADWSQGISVNNGYNNIVTVLATATDTAVSLWFKNAASYGSMYVCQID